MVDKDLIEKELFGGWYKVEGRLKRYERPHYFLNKITQIPLCCTVGADVSELEPVDPHTELMCDECCRIIVQDILNLGRDIHTIYGHNRLLRAFPFTEDEWKKYLKIHTDKRV